MNRTEIIQYLIDKKGFESYLEIGIGTGKNFKEIKCDVKEGVDPRKGSTYHMSSDKFFSTIKSDRKYDIIFIDGLHLEDQVDKDIQNSLNHLSKNGIIVMHDCNPSTHRLQAIPRQQRAWNGTVWKSFIKLRCSRPDLFMCVVDADHGCGIIKRGKQELYNKFPLKRCLRYNLFKVNRKEMLNLITVSEFKKVKW